MAKIGSMMNQSKNKLLLEQLELDLLDERGAYSRRNNSKNEYKNAQKQLSKTIAEIGRTEDVEIILSGEKAILQNERRIYANSPEMVKSLNAALEQVTTAQELSKMVHSPDSYKYINKAFKNKKNRVDGVPKDEARQFFESQRMRFSNLQRGRLSLSEKDAIGERHANMIIAKKTYTELQREAIGLNSKKKERGLGISM